MVYFSTWNKLSIPSILVQFDLFTDNLTWLQKYAKFGTDK